MKKVFVIGMVLVSAVTAQSTFAAPATAKPVMKRLEDYNLESRKHTFGGVVSARSLKGAQLETAKRNVINQLAVGGLKMELANALSGEPAMVQGRLDTLVTMVAAKRMSADIKNENPKEAQSIDASIKAQVELISNSMLISEKPTGDLKIANEALVKLSQIGGDIITNFDPVSRDSYTRIIKKTNELSARTPTLEEALIEAVKIEKTNGDKAKALEIIKKLKECV